MFYQNPNVRVETNCTQKDVYTLSAFVIKEDNVKNNVSFYLRNQKEKKQENQNQEKGINRDES